MKNIPQYIPFVAAILGIAYPILLQVVARLEEKYTTISIVEIFNKELEKRSFIILLISSLISILIWTFEFPPLFSVKNPELQWIINNSAASLVIISSVALVTSFFFFTKKIIVYYTTPKLLEYLFKRHRLRSLDEENLDFKIISDILLNLFRKDEKTNALTISRFLYDEFKNIREKNEGKPVEYPDAYYELVHSITQELKTSKNTLYPYLGVRAVGGIWLLGELQHSIISERTYLNLWHNLTIAADSGLDDLISSNWEFACQYYRNSLRLIDSEYNEESTQTNKKECLDRIEERKRFYEFYTAFGGLMLYTKRYDSIFHMFNYTSSTPAVYELLPESMNQIFESFFKFDDPYFRNFPFIAHKYSFPRLSGLNADGIIKNWICQYIALLFIRQYFTIANYVYQRPLDFPNIPASQQEKHSWLNSLDYFTRLVEDILSNKELLNILGYAKLTPSWCEQQGKLYPLDFLTQLKAKVQEEFEQVKVEQKISDAKFNKFKETTTTILTKTFTSALEIANNEIESSENEKWFCSGTKMLFDKSSFADNQEADHLNYDSFVAEQVSSDFSLAISQTAYIKKTKSYLVKSSEIFDAVDKIIKDDNSVIILNFGIHIPYYISTYNIKGLKEDNYNSIPIIKMAPYYRELIGESLFIIKKSDLPKMIFNKVSEEMIVKYGLIEFNKEFNIYGNVVDLHDNPDLINELIDKFPDEQLDKSVLVCVLINVSIEWKKNLKLTQIRLFSEYRNNGLPNKLDEIE